MKKIVLLSVFLIFQLQNSTIASQNQMSLAPKDPPQVINIYNNLNQHGSNQQSQTNSNIHTIQTTIVTHISNTVQQIITTIKTNVPKYRASLISYLQKNKKKVICSCILLSYITLFIYCSFMNTFLSNKTTWHCWKNELSFESFLQENNHDLFEQLLITIQQQYFNQNDPMNHLRPLIVFYNDITQEMNIIKRFLRIGSFLHNFYLISLFPISKKQIKKAKEKIKKLEALQKLFITQMAKHNLQSMKEIKKGYSNVVNPLPPITKTLPIFVPPRP